MTITVIAVGLDYQGGLLFTVPEPAEPNRLESFTKGYFERETPLFARDAMVFDRRPLILEIVMRALKRYRAVIIMFLSVGHISHLMLSIPVESCRTCLSWTRRPGGRCGSRISALRTIPIPQVHCSPIAKVLLEMNLAGVPVFQNFCTESALPGASCIFCLEFPSLCNLVVETGPMKVPNVLFQVLLSKEYSVLVTTNKASLDSVGFWTRCFYAVSTKGAGRIICFIFFSARSSQERTSGHTFPVDLWYMLCLLMPSPELLLQRHPAKSTLERWFGLSCSLSGCGGARYTP